MSNQWSAFKISLRAVRALLAFVFLGAGAGEADGPARRGALFDTVGVGQWFRYATGLCELGGAILVLMPRTRFVGATLLACVMIGAITAHLAILHTSPRAPFILLAFAGLVLAGSTR